MILNKTLRAIIAVTIFFIADVVLNRLLLEINLLWWPFMVAVFAVALTAAIMVYRGLGKPLLEQPRKDAA